MPRPLDYEAPKQQPERKPWSRHTKGLILWAVIVIWFVAEVLFVKYSN